MKQKLENCSREISPKLPDKGQKMRSQFVNQSKSTVVNLKFQIEGDCSIDTL